VESLKQEELMSLSIDNIKIKSKPDFNRLLRVLKRDGRPDRVPFYELHINIIDSIMKDAIKKGDCKDAFEYEIKKEIAFHSRAGYDYISIRADFSGIRGHASKEFQSGSDYLKADENFLFAKPGTHKGNTTEGTRDYIQAGDCIVGNMEEFEKYPWPDISKVNFSNLDRIKTMLPEGMKTLNFGPGGVLANVMWLMGYEALSFALIEDKALVKAVFDAVGSRLVKLIGAYAKHEIVGALVLNDDMGFKTQTLISPEHLREYCFPWHKKIVDAAHQAGKPILLHACGNLKEVYEDIIASGWDAKHSYEDIVDPVWEFKAKYGKRISCLGGFDMDKLSRFTPAEVRKHTRFLLDRCGKDGGYALGAGNSVADYVPVENYLAMLEEGFNYR